MSSSVLVEELLQASDAVLVEELRQRERAVDAVRAELHRRGLCTCGGMLRKLAPGEQPRPVARTLTFAQQVLVMQPLNTQCEACGASSVGTVVA